MIYGRHHESCLYIGWRFKVIWFVKAAIDMILKKPFRLISSTTNRQNAMNLGIRSPKISVWFVFRKKIG